MFTRPEPAADLRFLPFQSLTHSFALFRCKRVSRQDASPEEHRDEGSLLVVCHSYAKQPGAGGLRSIPERSFGEDRKSFRMCSCKSVSKQRTSTPFRMNTYKKPRGRKYRISYPTYGRRRMGRRLRGRSRFSGCCGPSGSAGKTGGE